MVEEKYGSLYVALHRSPPSIFKTNGCEDSEFNFL